MIIKEIKDYNSSEFKQSIELYKNSFPYNETRRSEDIENLLKKDENYYLIASLYNNLVNGISLMYVFRSLNFGLLDYIAIDPAFRSQGLGKKTFKFTYEKLVTIIPNGIGLVMEVQKENDLDKEGKDARKNRIKFYNSLEVKLLDKVNYFLPQIHSGTKEEEMHLMIKPLVKTDYLTREQVFMCIENIYRTIYQYHNNDLADKIFYNTPEKIILRSLL
ncbi:MAG TPA: GNAT family N-acetyltransferase [Candidatus Nitrosocosmicus sp.]|nr:GNAT family N-acetyltransferase [Candidatus Nitrosocosmicus sp.]